MREGEEDSWSFIIHRVLSKVLGYGKSSFGSLSKGRPFSSRRGGSRISVPI